MKDIFPSQQSSGSKDLTELKWLSLRCYEPWSRMYIHNFGQTTFCCFAEYSQIDNVKDKLLKDIWLGEFFSDIRIKMLNNELPDFCLACDSCLTGHSTRIRSELKALLGR